jgi:flagellar hook-associated protein 2
MSAVTFSGANGIDFSVILEAVMEQESAPLTTLQSKQESLETKSSDLTKLASVLATLEDAASALSTKSAFGAKTATSTDASIVAVTGTADSVIGTYDIVVNELARSQVTASSSRTADADTTIVATGGTLTIGGVNVAVSGSVTLQGLSDTINGTKDIGVSSSVVKTTTGYQLVLTGRETGEENGYTIKNSLTGSTVAFTDTDADGVSGDTAADNSMQATDANVLINNVEVTSASNTIEDAIVGTTLDLLRVSGSETVSISVTEASDETTDLVNDFVDAYNAYVDFIAAQSTSTTSTLTHDSLLRGLRNEVRSTTSGTYSTNSTLESLGQAGLEFDTSGHLSVDSDMLDDALELTDDSLRKLFMGDGTNAGVFDTLTSVIQSYTDAGGILSDEQDRLDDQIDAMDDRIAAMEDRLALRKASLQAQYAAADMVISQLNSQASQLSSITS